MGVLETAGLLILTLKVAIHKNCLNHVDANMDLVVQSLECVQYLNLEWPSLSQAGSAKPGGFRV